MCTVATLWQPGGSPRILAVRDEFVSRDFDDPSRWWADQPSVVGGRDRLAGGSWCVTDVATGVTALLLNRTERHTGSPSRGVLPLTAVAAGDGWTEVVDHREMASFTLVLAGPSGVVAWTWDATALTRVDLAPGLHVFTAAGIDAPTDKTARWAPRLADEPWQEVVAGSPPVDDRTALVVRHEFETDTYATVFVQLIDAAPGRLDLTYSRTPWLRHTWHNARFG